MPALQKVVQRLRRPRLAVAREARERSQRRADDVHRRPAAAQRDAAHAVREREADVLCVDALRHLGARRIRERRQRGVVVREHVSSVQRDGRGRCRGVRHAARQLLAERGDGVA